MKLIPSLISLALLAFLSCGRAGAEKPYDHISVTIIPSSVSVTTEGAKVFTSEVENSSQGVSWAVQEVETGGTIQASGLYTAPATTGVYHVVATSLENNSRKATATVKVVAPPIVDGFVASSMTLLPGAEATLTPVFSGGTASLEPGVGTVLSGRPYTVRPAVTTTFTLSVTNEAGTVATASLTINVGIPPVIQGFVAFPTLVSTGEPCTLVPTFSGGAGSIAPEVGDVVSGLSYTVNPTVTTTYTLAVTGNASASSVQVTVQVVPPPTILSFQALPNPILKGSSTRLSPLFLNGSGRITPGVGDIASGSSAQVSPEASTTYLLSVTNGAGKTVTSEAIVDVVGIQSFAASPQIITMGETATLVPVFTGGSGSISPGVGSVASGDSITVAPLATTAYTLTVTHPGGLGTQSTTTVTVVDPPRILSFTVAPNPLVVGQNAVLMPLFSGGTGAIDPGIGAVVSGQGVTVSPVQETIYTLTVTNAAGTITTATVDLQITPKGTFSPTQPMGTPRHLHTATRLGDGRVLVVGGVPQNGDGPPVLSISERFDPGSGLWSPTGSMISARQDHAAVRLSDGRVLVLGGSSDGSNALNTAEIYDPNVQAFTSTLGTMLAARRYPAAVLLQDGRVLVTGGVNSGIAASLASAEIYDPLTGLFSATLAPMANSRFQHSCMLLADGTVLVAGGAAVIGGTPTPLAQAETFDPIALGFTPTTTSMTTGRRDLSLVPLASGQVVLGGGIGFTGNPLAQVEVYDPAARSFNATTSAPGAWDSLRLAVLADGRILFVGVGGACIFDPAAAAMLPVNGTGRLATGEGTVSSLDNGKVLIVNLEGSQLFDPQN